MTRLFAAASMFALTLAACGPGYDEPGALETELETDGAEPGDAVDPSEIRTDEDGDRAATAPGEALSLEAGWVRNPIAGRAVTAGFFTLRNAGPAGRLVTVESPEAERVELHTMAMEGDVMRMRQVDGYDVPADGALTLQSGGDHLMIFGLPAEAAEDGELELVFTFEDGRTLEAALPFADSAPDAMSQMQDG